MTTSFAQPVVATYGSDDPTVPLVVLLHGRGADERSILPLAELLPAGPAYAAVRAPIAEGGGYAWFANRGIGRPVAESLRATMDWFRAWLDEFAPAPRPVVLIGFSGGAAFAGGLALDDPGRYTGLAVSHGTLPFDAGVPVEPGRLAHLASFVAQGDRDRVIPAELLARTWGYLNGESGASARAYRDDGGHAISAALIEALAQWLSDRLGYVTGQPVPVAGPPGVVVWPGFPGGELPERRGTRPEVSWSIPQQQENDNAPVELQVRLLAEVASQPGVRIASSHISVPGARAFLTDRPATNPQAFLVPGTGAFAHLHPPYDGSLHLALPPDLAADLVTRGWGQVHPLAGTRVTPGFVMVYGPREEEELRTVAAIVAASHAFATDRSANAGAS
jgi:phospholipase/carboxylesterase